MTRATSRVTTMRATASQASRAVMLIFLSLLVFVACSSTGMCNVGISPAAVACVGARTPYSPGRGGGAEGGAWVPPCGGDGGASLLNEGNSVRLDVPLLIRRAVLVVRRHPLQRRQQVAALGLEGGY